MPAFGDELRDLLSALLADLLEVLVTVLLGDGVASDLADATIEARAVELLHFLATLFADLLVEVGAVPLRGRAPALLADLLVELRTMSLRGGRASTPSGFGDSHRSFVSWHTRAPFLADKIGRLLAGLDCDWWR